MLNIMGKIMYIHYICLHGYMHHIFPRPYFRRQRGFTVTSVLTVFNVLWLVAIRHRSYALSRECCLLMLQPNEVGRINDQFCGHSENVGIDGSRYPMVAETNYTSSDYHITAIQISIEGNKTVAIMGTSTGHLIKVCTSSWLTRFVILFVHCFSFLQNCVLFLVWSYEYASIILK
jgi:hypothetical protein